MEAGAKHKASRQGLHPPPAGKVPILRLRPPPPPFAPCPSLVACEAEDRAAVCMPHPGRGLVDAVIHLVKAARGIVYDQHMAVPPALSRAAVRVCTLHRSRGRDGVRACAGGAGQGRVRVAQGWLGGCNILGPECGFSPGEVRTE